MYKEERLEEPLNHSEASQANEIQLKNKTFPKINNFRTTSKLTPRLDLNGEATIQTSTIKNFKLQSGVVLDEARIGFCVFSSTNNNENKELIVVHPALTGTARARLEKPTNGSQGDGWWSGCVGQGINPETGKEYLLNTERYKVICFDHFGGRKLSEQKNGSTSASELGQLQSQVSLADGVNLASTVLLENFGVENVKAVLGGSMGGGQAFEWISQNGINVERIVEISTCSVLNTTAKEFFSIQTDFLRDEKNITERIENLANNVLETLPNIRKTKGFTSAIEHILKGFKEYEQGKLPIEESIEKSKLFLVRQFGFILFVTPEFFQNKLNKHGPNFLSTYLNGHGMRFTERFDCEGLANICAMIANAKEVKPNVIAEKIKSKNISITRTADNKDILFPVSHQELFNRELRDALSATGKFSEYLSNDENTGHDRFLTPSFLNEDAEFIRKQLTKD